jgi:hypothetical protein
MKTIENETLTPEAISWLDTQLSVDFLPLATGSENPGLQFLKPAIERTAKHKATTMDLEPEVTRLAADDSLLIDFRSLDETYWRVSPWDQGLSIWQLHEGQWKHVTDDIGILLCSDEHETNPHTPVARFSARIPPPLRRAVAPFSFNHVPLLHWASVST